MALKSIPWMQQDPPDAGQVAALLEEKGRTVGEGGVSVRKRREDDDPATKDVPWIIDIDTLSTAAANDIATWTPPADQTIAAREELMSALQDIQKTSPETRTPADRAVLALTRIAFPDLF